MNKIFLSFIFVTALFLPVSLFAATEKIDNSFRVSVDKIENNNFYFSPKDIKNNQNIKSWRVRFYCDKDMAIKFVDKNKNFCSKSVKFENSTILPNMFTFENKNTKNKNFSFALKSYDQKGKWMHTSRQNFSWK